MDKFDLEHLENIRTIFEKKTGATLPAGRTRAPMKLGLVLAAVLVCGLTMTAFAAGMFSSLSGDELRLAAEYQGDGVVSIQVENLSDRDLHFEPRLKLMLWSTGEEVTPVSDQVVFTGTEIGAQDSGVMTIDLSRAYDIAALEEPLSDDHYYFVLTNNNFAFGQDWMCTVSFSQPAEQTVTDEEEPVEPTVVETEGDVPEELSPYLEQCITGAPGDRQAIAIYLSKVQEVLSELDVQAVSPVSPLELTVDMEPGTVFDDTVPADKQAGITGLQYRALDQAQVPVGATRQDSLLTLSVLVPQRKGDMDGGADLPLIYVAVYNREDTQNSENHAFIRGHLLTFEEMEPYKVYADEKYVCYEVTDFFFSDLQQYVAAFRSQRKDIYYDEQVWERIENFYAYYRDRDTLARCITYNPLVR